MNQVRVAILGSGNIGTDLMEKIRRQSRLELVAMIGVDPESDGLRRARNYGVWTTSAGLQGFLAEGPAADVVFDATSASAHLEHSRLLQAAGVRCIDLTPAKIAPAVVPVVNLGILEGCDEVNLITCGAQATVPIVAALASTAAVPYAEIVSTISSKSAGPGTRQNIDEFTISTAKALEEIGGAAEGKAIIILNPAEPPLMMRNTVHAVVPDADAEEIRRAVHAMVDRVREYVPGYRLKQEPLVKGDQVTVFLEVEGAGDFLPPYAGNLDIMTSAAIKVAEAFTASQELSS